MSAALNWIEALRELAAGIGQKAAAKRIGYSTGVVSGVLSGAYKGDLSSVQIAVEGALMAVRVDCPVVGDISRPKCLELQRAPRLSTNSARAELYAACRGGCPHSLIRNSSSSAGASLSPASSASAKARAASSTASAGHCAGKERA